MCAATGAWRFGLLSKEIRNAHYGAQACRASQASSGLGLFGVYVVWLVILIVLYRGSRAAPARLVVELSLRAGSLIFKHSAMASHQPLSRETAFPGSASSGDNKPPDVSEPRSFIIFPYLCKNWAAASLLRISFNSYSTFP